MNKLLDLLAEIEASVEWAVDDRKDRENIMDWIHQAMDIAVKGKAHKWPEEKPAISGSRYLVLIDRGYTSFIDILFWGGSDWVRFKHNDDRTYVEADDDVTHWWNLPEVTE